MKKAEGQPTGWNQCFDTVGWVTGIISDASETHTHNHFIALLDFVQDYPGERAPES